MNNRNWGGRRENAGRKATGKSTSNISLTLTHNQKKVLLERAQAEKLTVSKFIAKYLLIGVE